MIYSFTGHRPDKLGGYSPETLDILYTFACKQIVSLKPQYCISGMALGWDTAVAMACVTHGIPWTAAIPFPEQPNIWRPGDRDKWNILVSKATKKVIVSPKFSIANLQKRNEWMVDNSNTLIALHDGSKGGTYNCIKYATGKVPVINWWNDWQDFNSNFIQFFS